MSTGAIIPILLQYYRYRIGNFLALFLLTGFLSVELVVRESLSQKPWVGEVVQSGLKFRSGLKPSGKHFFRQCLSQDLHFSQKRSYLNF